MLAGVHYLVVSRAVASLSRCCLVMSNTPGGWGWGWGGTNHCGNMTAVQSHQTGENRDTQPIQHSPGTNDIGQLIMQRANMLCAQGLANIASYGSAP